MNKMKFFIVAILAMFLTACTSPAEANKTKAKIISQQSQKQHQTYNVNGRQYTTKTVGTTHYEKQGGASFYHNKFQGRRTASGEIFHQKHLTAAHRTLPFGSHVLVTNKRNGRQVVVRINDRGPFIKGRIIDLSRAAAAQIGMIGAGVANVKVERLYPVHK